MKRVCPICDGGGCSECDHTGERHTTHLEAESGVTMRVQGSRVLTAEEAEALRGIAAAAFDRMDAEPERPDCATCHGTGTIATVQMVMGFPQPMPAHCPDCRQDPS